MGIAQVFVEDVVSIVIFVLVVAGIMKVFQMAGDLRETKEILKDMRRSQQVASPLMSLAPASVAPPSPSLPSLQSALADPAPALRPQLTPEDLVRAVHAQKFSDDEFPALEPVILPPQS
ncbi:MAG TPA: hypothetical protein VGN17_06175 [Bryobacteraceae bacterium]